MPLKAKNKFFALDELGKIKIAIIGLGYVGLPLAAAFAKKFAVLGFDIDQARINGLKQYQDDTLSFSEAALKEILQGDTKMSLSHELSSLADSNVYIVTVPTPIDQFKEPDLAPLKSATSQIAQYLKKGDTVVYESTVYPGCTEEVCVPLLEEISGLVFNQDFSVGYSPERINPGDQVNTLEKIVKVTSGSNPKAALFVDQLYQQIIESGTYLAPSIKVAEAAKAIENAQRDINISFINELALIFDKIGLDTQDVLDAAATKWNFLKYKPGLVGGHCIGVDPYYLAHKAKELGYHPDVILSGRRVNDMMGHFVAQKLIKLLLQKGHSPSQAKVLILGITFKENCPDIRNTKVVDIYTELKSYQASVSIYDPWANANQVAEEYDIELLPKLAEDERYTAIILAVAHTQFLALDYHKLLQKNGVIFDTKSILDRSIVDSRL